MNNTNQRQLPPEGEELPKKRVVRIVRKVIRKVVPGEGRSEKEKSAAMKQKEQVAEKKVEGKSISVTKAGPRTDGVKAMRLKDEKNVPIPPKAETVIPTKKMEKDDISTGLTSLMARGKSKDRKIRVKSPEKKEDISNSVPATRLNSPSPETGGVLSEPRVAALPTSEVHCVWLTNTHVRACYCVGGSKGMQRYALKPKKISHQKPVFDP